MGKWQLDEEVKRKSQESGKKRKEIMKMCFSEHNQPNPLTPVLCDKKTLRVRLRPDRGRPQWYLLCIGEASLEEEAFGWSSCHSLDSPVSAASIVKLNNCTTRCSGEPGKK